jgi:parallel beta-helix repeat protein
MKNLFINFLILSFIFTSSAFAGTVHYVDTTASGGTHVGTWDNKFQTIAQVNAHSFSEGDDVYFKVGQTWTETAGLDIDWYGNSGDWVKIGAWSAEDTFTLDGNARPIIDGNTNTYPTGDYGSLVRRELDVQGTGYIWLENLRVQYSSCYGVTLKKTSNFWVENCYFYRNKNQGIVVARTHSGTITKSTAEQNSYLSSPGAGIELTGAQHENETYDVTVSHCKVFHNYEGIGTYKMAKDCIIEYNELFDNRSYMLYIGQSQGTKARFNLVYNSVDFGDWTGSGERKSLIAQDNESFLDECYLRNSEIHGNLLGGGLRGIAFSVNKAGCESSGHNVHDNTIVDCVKNFKMGSLGAGSFHSGVLISNNISLTLSGDSDHVEGCMESGIVWDNNMFDEDPYPSGIGTCENGKIVDDPEILKESGWRVLVAEWVKGSEFSLKPTSPAINAATVIAGYNDRIKAGDFSLLPADSGIGLYDDSADPDIGAWAYEGIPVSSSPQPSGTPACSEDPIPLSLQITADKYSDCQWCKDGNGGCDSETVYGGDTMAAFESTGVYLSTHDISEACGQQNLKYWSICRNHFTLQEQTAPTAHDFSTGGGSAPSTSPPGGGLIDLGSGAINMSIGTIVSGVDIGIIDLM